MADINEQSQWEDTVYQLETTDPVVGGPDGISNTQAKQLANRTAWLKSQVEQLLSELNAIGIDDVSGLPAALNGKAASAHNHNASEITRGTLSLSRLSTASRYTDASPSKLALASAVRSLYDWVVSQLTTKAEADALTRHLGNAHAHGEYAPLSTYNRSQQAQDGRLTTLEGTTEKRHVQTITIAGSTNYLYPVFWQFPDNRFGVGKLEISRHYGWNQGVLPNDYDQPYRVASLLLQLEGNDAPWGGDAEYMKVLKYFRQYHKTASHLRYMGYARREKINATGVALYGAANTNYTHSGIYLRGGGLRYRFSSNWPLNLIRLADENSATARAVLTEQYNTRWYVQRIPFTALEEPTED